MRKAAVLVVDGYEESETVTIVDLLRRAGIECHTFGFAEQYVRGMQGMMIKVDKIFSDEIKNYDMLVLPGGRPGGVNLGANPLVIEMVQYYNENGKYLAAICSGTIVLSKARIIDGESE